MKNKNLLSFLLVLLSLNSIKIFAQEEIQLKVITYNIRSIEPNFDVQPHIDYILKEKPDLVAYQEVETRTSRMNNRDLILEIATKTGMFTLFSPAYKKGNGHYGNAILSKYPITSSVYKQLPTLKEAGGSDERVALISDITIKPKKTIRFINVHLDHKLPDNGNKQKQLKPAIENLDDKKVILAGDFNVFIGGDLMNNLSQKFDRQTNNSPTHQGGAKIDYIMTYPKNSWKRISTKVDYGLKLSDHYPVISVIKLK